MTSVFFALVWFAVLWIAVTAASLIARKARLTHAAARPEARPPRHAWGGLPDKPAGDHGPLRALAKAARLARGRAEVVDRSRRVARVSRGLSIVSALTALSLLPFAGSTHAGAGGTGAILDLDSGLGLVAVLMLISCVGSTTAGLAEGGTWARLGALRVATESLIGVALFFLLLAPIFLQADSLRLSEVVARQQGAFVPFGWLAHSVPALASAGLDSLRLPGWFVFRQPLTAILMIPALYTLTRRPFAYQEISNTVSASGLGFDADPSELYWAKLDARFSQVLAAALLVVLFLGAGGLPYFDGAQTVAWMEPRVGPMLPVLLLWTLEAGVFMVKLLLVLQAEAWVRQATGRARPDQSMRLLTRRLVPLAWANFLLIASIELLDLASTGGGVR